MTVRAYGGDRQPKSFNKGQYGSCSIAMQSGGRYQ
jgi:hypothetical protein